MKKEAVCSEPYANMCYNACCYEGKPIFEPEIEKIGLENIIEKSKGLYLKNKEGSMACIFLDEDNNKCNIYEKRPFACQTYFCHDQSAIRIQNMAQEATYDRKKRRTKIYFPII
jgi:Fe-S-cluster containining protein